MKLIHILQCGECPMYTYRREYAGVHHPDVCRHPYNEGITLGGPDVMRHKCPMLKTPIVYKAALQSKPKCQK